MAKVIYNNIIPIKGYQAITVWPFVFARKSAKWLKDYVKNHESIHLRQQFEVMAASAVILAALCLSCISWWWMFLALAVYYLWCGIEYVVRLFLYGNHKEAYRNIAAEQEAYLHEDDFNYLAKDRRMFAWVRYITMKTYKRK